MGGLASAIALSVVTLWTGYVFWKHRRRTRSTSATVLAATFVLWGLHHLDYPLLRPMGSGVVYGALADVLFIILAATATLPLRLRARDRPLQQRQNDRHQVGTHLHLSGPCRRGKRRARISRSVAARYPPPGSGTVTG